MGGVLFEDAWRKVQKIPGLTPSRKGQIPLVIAPTHFVKRGPKNMLADESDPGR